MSSEITENEVIQLVREYYGIDEMPDNLTVGQLRNSIFWSVHFTIRTERKGKIPIYSEYLAFVNPITREVQPQYLL